MSETAELMARGSLAEIKAVEEATLAKSIAIGTKVDSIEDQAKEGNELINVYLDPIMKTKPFGTFVDPYTNYQSQGFQPKPTLMNFKLLRRMARKVEPVSAIIKLRCNQVGSFSRVSEDLNMPGFRVMLQNKQATPTKQQIEEMKLIEKFFINTGFNYNPDRLDNFEQYQRKVVRDRLTLDAITTQIVASKSGEISEFWAMDAASIAFATDDYNPKRGESYQPVRFVQQSNAQIFGEFTALELAYGVANPTTDLEHFGYGESELELLIEVVSSYLFSRDYNKFFFTRNSIPAGVLALNGKYKEEELTMFRRQWAAQVHGVNNAWRVPIIASEEGKGVDFKSFKTTQRDAEFMKWMDFLIKITAAVYQTSPEEINFAMGASGDGSSPMMAKEGGQAILASKDRGLVPLLRFLENYYNKNLVTRMNPEYRFVFTGIEPEDEEKKLDIKTKKKFYYTINEIRKEDDLAPLDINTINNPFDLPDNPVILNMWQAQQQQEQMMEQGGMPGAEGAEGGMPGAEGAEGGMPGAEGAEQPVEEDLETPEEI